MSPFSGKLAIAAALAFVLAPAAARAQWYSSYPQHTARYAEEPYAIQVAPGTYRVRHIAARHRAERDIPDKVRRRTHNDPALIEELRRRNGAKHGVYAKGSQKTKIVREKPIVIVHKRIVDVPPRVIVGQLVIDDLPRGRGLFQPEPQEPTVEDLPPVTTPPVRRHAARHAARHRVVRAAHVEHHVEHHKAVPVETGSRRVIKANAEVTILGSDRMTIRLFRKGRSTATD